MAGGGTPDSPPTLKPFRFLDLCPEMRNKIYEAVYDEVYQQPSINTELSDLLQSLPPINLILTSRQIHSEASGYYVAALCHFWTTRDFTFNTSKPWPSFLGSLDAMYMRSNENIILDPIGRRIDQLAKLDIEIWTKSGTLTSSVLRFSYKGVAQYVVAPKECRQARPQGIVAFTDSHAGMLDLMARWYVDYHGNGMRSG